MHLDEILRLRSKRQSYRTIAEHLKLAYSLKLHHSEVPRFLQRERKIRAALKRELEGFEISERSPSTTSVVGTKHKTRELSPQNRAPKVRKFIPNPHEYTL